MNKEMTLNALQDAKKRHLEQMEKIEILLGGKRIKNPTPVSKTECEFGKIFYGQKEHFYSLLGAQFYERLDLLHEQWHKQYAKIDALFFEEKSEGFLSKLLGSSKIDPLHYDKAKLYFVELNTITQELLKLLETSMRRVEALSDTKFKT